VRSEQARVFPLKALDRTYLVAGENAGSHYRLSPPRRLQLGAVGGHQGARAGSSLEFKEHRDYQPGDDLRHIDWNAYARSDLLTVKLFHEEIHPHLDVVLDGSRSMALEGSVKGEAALGLAAFFAAAAENSGIAHRVWLAEDGCEPVANSTGLPAGWGEVRCAWRGSPAESFARRPPAWRPRGIRVLLSDLLWPGEPLEVLGPCADGASAVIVVQLLAESDARPAEQGNLRLVDVETDRVRQVFLDAAARQRYRAALDRHQQSWHLASRQVGATLTTVIAEQLVRDWRLDELVVRGVLSVAF
jgi:uncharacterized protein (DUF58 family)